MEQERDLAGQIAWAREDEGEITGGRFQGVLLEGADLWEQGLKRWCAHGKMEYMGMLCRRDMGRKIPFMDDEKEQAARDFARAIGLAVKAEELCAR